MTTRIDMTHARASEMHSVNSAINAEVRYVPDIDKYKRPEYWAKAETEGDCEDYAIAKLLRLRNTYGWPPQVLDIGVCFTENNEGHAVLIVRGSDADWILDNRRAGVWPWDGTGYKWIEHTVEGSFRHWMYFPGGDKLVTTSSQQAPG